MKRWGFDVRFRLLRGPEDFNNDHFIANANSIDTCCAALFILTEEGVNDQSGFLDELLYASNQKCKLLLAINFNPNEDHLSDQELANMYFLRGGFPEGSVRIGCRKNARGSSRCARYFEHCIHEYLTKAH